MQCIENANVSQYWQSDVKDGDIKTNIYPIFNIYIFSPELHIYTIIYH